MARFILAFAVLALLCAAGSVLCAEHSLYYTYTALSKPLQLPGIYEFTALGMLDDRELDYYSSRDQIKVPKQNWMKDRMPADYWEKGTQSRKSKEQWFKVNVDILIERMRHNKTDLHVLQWRHGCTIDEDKGNVKFLRGVDEYSYDGSEFLSFDEENSRWIAPVSAAEPTKKKWDDVQILNQYTKGYLEKECVDWLTKFMDYGKEELRNFSPPEVQLFAKKSKFDSTKLHLTCLATGFYPEDVVVLLRKRKTALPDHLVESSGVRPNGDGTYQLRKSVEIKEEDKKYFDCFVNHITLEKPIVTPEDKEIPCLDCTLPKIQSGIIGGVVGVLITLAVVAVVIFLLWKNNKIQLACNRTPTSSSSSVETAGVLVSEPLMSLSVSTLAAPAAHTDSQPGIGSQGELGKEDSDTSSDSDSQPGIGSQGELGKEDSDTSSDSGKGSPDSSPEGSNEEISEKSKMLPQV